MTSPESFVGSARIGQIAVPVADLDRAAAFYEHALGLRLLFRAPPGLAFFECGSVRLMLTRPEGEEAGTRSGIIYYQVPDLTAAYDSLRGKGVEFVHAPHLIARMPDHDLWMAFVHDSEGNLLGLMSEVRTAEPERQPQLVAVSELAPGAPERFTGAVRVGTVAEIPGSPLSVYEVLFSAGARTVWHRHAGAQILVGLDGQCFFQIEGEGRRRLGAGQAVRIPGGVRHWHGAGHDGAASHLAVNQVGATQWGGEVSETDYRDGGKLEQDVSRSTG